MSERAEHLAVQLDTELSRMIDFLSGLSGSQLDAACKDPQGATVSHVLAHLREGTDQVVEWAQKVSGKPSAADTEPSHGHGHDHDHGHDHGHGHGQGHGHAHDHDHGHVPDGHAHASTVDAAAHPHPQGLHDHGHSPANGGSDADLDQTVAKLRDGGAVIVGAVRGLTDEQLDFVPPESPGLADGATPLHAIVAFIADDVAGHLEHLKRAVADDDRAARTVA